MRITKSSVKDVSLDTIIDTLLWYKTWQHSGYNHTRLKRKLHKKHKRAYRSSWSRPVIYTDNSFEFGKACEELTWNHCASTPHRSEANGIGERAVCRVKEGTSAVLLQSGLDESWWADSMECYCYLQNIQDLLSDRKTPYEMRFGIPFNGPVIPFELHTISAKDLSRLHQFGSKVLPGIFLGNVLFAGGIWKGAIMVADIEELEEMDASELHVRRLTKEVLIPKPGEFVFPFADGTLKISGEDQEGAFYLGQFRLRPSSFST